MDGQNADLIRHLGERVEIALNGIHRIEHFLEIVMTAELQALQAEIVKNRDVIASAEALLQRLSGLILANIDDRAALTDLANSLRTDDAGLADAIAANTPADTTPPAEPTA
jgi:hypothetical protein